ncbi:hypothetical protein IQ07DRAFT_640957 [Pyrenochaeta sp. DS3sAY3a]|nr:hypothetical protein IQ07DRAFT_640957 [Pyrenochaeta sp. DS3sAY3a]
MATDQGHARLPRAPSTQFVTAKSSYDVISGPKNERGHWICPTRATPKPSLDFTQRLERKWAEYNASQNVVKRWLFEIVSWLLSALCMGTMIGIYLRINRKALSNSDTLITLANILGKVASAALIVPTSEALGQLKWNWFHGSSQAVWDFEIFDKASRGPWGAALLLYRTKGRSLAALGALLIVLLLAVDSFFQQVVELPTRWTLQDTGDLPLSIRYELDATNVYQEGAEMNVADKDMGLVVDKFSFANGTQPTPFGNGTRPDIPLSCPTSKCTWPVYNTLGVCSQCSDISEQLTFACLTTTIDWTADLYGGYKVEGGYPKAAVCGYFLNATSEAPVLMSGYLVDSDEAGVTSPGETLLMRTMPLTSNYDFAPLYGNGSINYKHLRNTISDVLIVSAVNGSADAVHAHTLPIAQECVLFWCVKSIQSTYDWGKYEEEVLDSFTNSTPGPFPWISTPYQTNFSNGTDNFYLQDILIDVEDASGNQSSTSHFGTSNRTALTIGQSLQDIFPSYTTIRKFHRPSSSI